MTYYTYDICMSDFVDMGMDIDEKPLNFLKNGFYTKNLSKFIMYWIFVFMAFEGLALKWHLWWLSLGHRATLYQKWFVMLNGWWMRSRVNWISTTIDTFNASDSSFRFIRTLNDQNPKESRDSENATDKKTWNFREILRKFPAQKRFQTRDQPLVLIFNAVWVQFNIFRI